MFEETNPSLSDPNLSDPNLSDTFQPGCSLLLPYNVHICIFPAPSSTPHLNYFVVKWNAQLVKGSQQWKMWDAHYPFPCWQWNEELPDWQLSICYFLRQMPFINHSPEQGKEPVTIPCNCCWRDLRADSEERPYTKRASYHCTVEMAS